MAIPSFLDNYQLLSIFNSTRKPYDVYYRFLVSSHLHLFLSFVVFPHSSILGMLQYFTVFFADCLSPCVYLSLVLYTAQGVQEDTALKRAHIQGIVEEQPA